MLFVSFPLRLDNAFLRRCEEAEGIVALVRLMATTPHGSWAFCPSFGVRDYFEQARVKPDLPRLAVAEINRSLEDLGITRYKVQSIASEPQPNRDVDSYVVTLVDSAGEPLAVKV
jgi:uncharacterized protein YjiS (DUF1127 family)